MGRTVTKRFVGYAPCCQTGNGQFPTGERRHIDEFKSREYGNAWAALPQQNIGPSEIRLRH